jgi:beta-galactosidase
MLREVLKRYDTTRLTTVAMHPGYRNWNTDSLPSDLALKTDIQSYNYRYMYFPGDGQRFPWMTFYQSEANTSNMGPNFYEMDLNKVIGLAYWGTIDYLGESQKWPAKGWAQGVFDISLQPKPKAYLMKSLFSEEPIVHIGIVEDSSPEYVQYGRSLSENWNRKEGSVVKIYTYTNAEEVELLINGQSQGKKENSMVPRVRNRVVWENVPYQEGRIEAIAYNKGKVVARHQLETTGEAVQLFAEADNSQWKADGMDLQHINIVAVDQKGRQVWVADDELTFEVEGPARLIAVSNGDITSDEPNVTSKRHLWNGHAMAILRAGREKGKVLLRVKSKYQTISIPFQLQ